MRKQKRNAKRKKKQKGTKMKKTLKKMKKTKMIQMKMRYVSFIMTWSINNLLCRMMQVMMKMMIPSGMNCRELLQQQTNAS